MGAADSTSVFFTKNVIEAISRNNILRNRSKATWFIELTETLATLEIMYIRSILEFIFKANASIEDTLRCLSGTKITDGYDFSLLEHIFHPYNLPVKSKTREYRGRIGMRRRTAGPTVGSPRRQAPTNQILCKI